MLVCCCFCRVVKPAKRTKEARSWEGGSVSKNDLGSLDCSDKPAGVEYVNGDSNNVDVSFGGREGKRRVGGRGGGTEGGREKRGGGEREGG